MYISICRIKKYQIPKIRDASIQSTVLLYLNILRLLYRFTHAQSHGVFVCKIHVQRRVFVHPLLLVYTRCCFYLFCNTKICSCYCMETSF